MQPLTKNLVTSCIAHGIACCVTHLYVRYIIDQTNRKGCKEKNEGRKEKQKKRRRKFKRSVWLESGFVKNQLYKSATQETMLHKTKAGYLKIFYKIADKVVYG